MRIVKSAAKISRLACMLQDLPEALDARRVVISANGAKHGPMKTDNARLTKHPLQKGGQIRTANENLRVTTHQLRIQQGQQGRHSIAATDRNDGGRFGVGKGSVQFVSATLWRSSKVVPGRANVIPHPNPISPTLQPRDTSLKIFVPEG